MEAPVGEVNLSRLERVISGPGKIEALANELTTISTVARMASTAANMPTTTCKVRSTLSPPLEPMKYWCGFGTARERRY
jgi:hypothetical protein